MAQPNEITIRVSSPILFIDDDFETFETSGPSGQNSFQSLTVVSRKPQSLDRGNTSLDTSPMPSFSPKAPLAKEEQSSESTRTGSRRQQFELTIRGENTIINIQTIGKSERHKDETSNQSLIEFINRSVQQIFQTPRKDEIEKALENVGFHGDEERKFTKQGTWKMLSRSAKEFAKKNDLRFAEREERYPSIVLLQDPPAARPLEDCYPKMVTMEGETSGHSLNIPGLEHRSRSMLSFHDMSELCFEQQNIARERNYLEKEKKSLEEEREGLEKGKNKIEKEKRTLERSKSFLLQDQHILQEKKQVLKEERATFKERPESGYNILKKEKLCIELEKQLLEDEKKIINEEQNILEKEKDILDKEKTILGGEKDVLEEEKTILGKEKIVLEKQNSILSERSLRLPIERDSSRNQSDEIFSEIEDVFEETRHFSNKTLRGHHHPPPRGDTISPAPHCSTNLSPCSLSTPYPAYIPVYNLPRPPRFSYQPCCSVDGGLKRSKSIQTQTEKRSEQKPQVLLPAPNMTDSTENDLTGLPFGLLTGMFPRVLITSMNTMQHGAEERADKARFDAKHSQIREMLPEAPTIIGPSKTKRKGAKKVMKVAPKKTLQNLKPPTPDITMKAKSSPIQMTTSYNVEEPETEAEESGIQTLTSDTHLKDDNSGVSDETISVETIHFGYSDDFYSNEAIFPKKPSGSGSQLQKSSDQKLPLTNVGYDMYEKLTQLNPDRGSNPSAEVQEGNTPINSNLNCGSNLHVNLHVHHGNIQLTLPGFGFMTMTCGGKFSSPKSDGVQLTPVETGKPLVKISDLWHTDAKIAWQGKQEIQENPQFSVTMLGGPELKVTLDPTKKSDSSQLLDNNKAINIIVGSNKCTCEAQVGTDDQIVGKTAPPSSETHSQLSPRTADLLKALRQKLEPSESEKKIVSFGKAVSDDRILSENRINQPLNGLFFVRQVQAPIPPKVKPKPCKAPRRDLPTKEYLCEECLATMRLYEGDFQSVQNIVDKFENMGRFGFK